METIEISLLVIDLETLEIVDELQRFFSTSNQFLLTELYKELTYIQQVRIQVPMERLARSYESLLRQIQMQLEYRRLRCPKPAC